MDYHQIFFDPIDECFMAYKEETPSDEAIDLTGHEFYPVGSLKIITQRDKNSCLINRVGEIYPYVREKGMVANAFRVSDYGKSDLYKYIQFYLICGLGQPLF